jgi:hypothetical protein
MKNYKAMKDKLHALVPLGTVPAGKKENVPQSRSENSGEERTITTCQEAKANHLGRSLTPKQIELSQPFFLTFTCHQL